MWDILTARLRGTNQPRALECDANGTLYTTPGVAGVVQDVNLEQVDGNAVVGDGPANNRLPTSPYMQVAAAGDTTLRGGALDDDTVAAATLGQNVRAYIAGWTGAWWIRLRATPAGILHNYISDGNDVAQGTTTDAEAAAGNGTVIALLKRLRTLMASLLVVGGGAEATAQRVTIANDSTGLLSVDDGGGSLTVDQATHDLLNANANIQVGDADVSGTNPVPVETDGDTISQTPTITAGAYAAGDAVGGLLTFANAARVAGGGGVIKDVIILDDAGQDAEMELWLFRETFVAMADNAPWAPSEADLRKLIGIVTTANGAWFDAGTPSSAVIEASQRYDLVGTSMFGQLVTRGTPTFAATDDVTAIVGLLQD